MAVRRRAGVLPIPTKAISSDWCCNREMNLRAKGVHKVSGKHFAETSPSEVVDWSEMFPSNTTPLQINDSFQASAAFRSFANNVDNVCYMAGRMPPEKEHRKGEPCSADCLTSTCLELCSASMKELGITYESLKQEAAAAGLWSSIANFASKFQVLVRPGGGLLLRVDRPGEKLLKSIVSRHPVVTSLRCEHLNWDDAFLDNDADRHLQYWSSFDLHYIRHSALVIGFSPGRWILYHPKRGVFSVRNNSKIDTGVGEVIFIPVC